MKTPERSWILDKLYAHYGSWYKLSQALKAPNQRIYGWKMYGYIPERAALDIEGLKLGISAHDVLKEARKLRSSP